MDRERRASIGASVLYLSTAMATAFCVGYALLAAGSMFAPVSSWEYVSLSGSVTLLLAAFMCFFSRRAGAILALCGTIGVWSLYAPVIFGFAKMYVTDQQISLVVMVRSSPSLPLSIQQLPTGFFLPETTIERLKSIGLSGKLSVQGSGSFGKGRRSHVTIVLESPVTVKVRLPEPDATDITYVQHGNAFTMYPSDARTISRVIDVQPMWDDPNQTEILVELAGYATQGFGVLFPQPRSVEGTK